MSKLRNAFIVGAFLTCPVITQAAICPSATPSNAPGFCSSFKIAAQCHCSKSLPAGMCVDERQLFKRMLAAFGSLQRACESQHDTSTQECVDDWNCYLRGGVTSNLELCSGTGAACI